MAKNIIVCSDGTGNTAIKGRGTNVFKLFEALDLTHHRLNPNLTPQIAFYDDGVGTQSFKPLKIFAGMTGFGLSRNVKRLYTEIVRIYDPGDHIYMFGFSRGAFTVRTLVGFIASCGLIDPRGKDIETANDLHSKVEEAYRIYRQRYRPKLWERLFGKPDASTTTKFRERFSRNCEVHIKFLGVWDTVDAVGLPFHLADFLNAIIYRFKFPDHRLSGIVDQACHALSVDDARHSFTPLLWDERDEAYGRIEQVWFSGAHSNVGGGYPKQGMSIVALDWMMNAAEKAGLRFLEGDRRFYSEHANVDDKLYDPRSGLGVFYRWKPRDLFTMCQQASVAPRLHLSVLERVAHGTENYAPGNLPFAQAMVTPSSADSPELLKQRAEEVQSVLRQFPMQSLLPKVKKAVSFARFSYYTYLAVWAFILASLVSAALAMFRVLRPFISLRGALGTILLGFGAAYAMQIWAERKMMKEFSGFWHQVQPNLRSALKQAREVAKKKAA
ncbi:MAG TPA: DUF2235 domain-containing protein [Candidatus Angelobacter sp.]|nr:DUF2235 domain-containing protein [Candidatus Angelobacter sp.]